MVLKEAEDLKMRLEAASAPIVVGMALEVVHRRPLHRWWGDFVSRLKQLELEALDAIIILHCMVKMEYYDRDLLSKVVDHIEGRYFSMQLGLEDHKALEMFPHSNSFQSLVNSLPVRHKVKIILMDRVGRDKGNLKERPLPSEPDPAKKWKTIDPVEMEAWERERFEKGRLRVKRVRRVESKVTRMRPGNKLAATLAAQFMQVVPGVGHHALAEIVQVTAFPQVRPLHGDLLEDFQEALSKRVFHLNTHQVMSYILAFTAGMRDFGGPEAYRAWRRKLLPAVIRVAKAAADTLSILDGQRAFHSQLRGVSHRVDKAVELESLQSRAERAAQLFMAVVMARQVDVDTQLFDILTGPLKASVKQWLASRNEANSSNVAGSADLLFPLETLADILGGCVACGVMDGGVLPQLLVGLFVQQFARDITERRLALSEYSLADLSVTAHGVALLCGRGRAAEETLGLIWMAAESRLRKGEPHFVLMLLDAMVSGGSEAVLISPPLLAAVDEYLVQRLDLDPAVLGRLCV